jgi:TPR repeat protein
MNRIVVRGLVVASLALGYSDAAWSAPIDDAKAAYLHHDYAKAARLIRPLAQRGNADAQARLGDLYARGRGVAQSYVAAARWYRLAAVQGNARAQNNLGLMYYYSKTATPSDYVRAYMWFDLAADARNGEALTNRKAAAALLRPDQIARAHAMARICRASRFRSCG